MAAKSFLLKKWLWLLFLIVVIVGLYLYGLKMSEDKTELAESKRALEISKRELQISREQTRLSEIQIEKEGDVLKKLNDSLDKCNNLISKLNDSIYKIEMRQREVITKYSERVVYKNTPEPYHQYGKGNGSVTLYKLCNCYNLKFWIDGEYAGQATDVFESKISKCGVKGSVTKAVLAGKHRIQGQDQENHSWDFYVVVQEDECLILPIKL